MNKDVAQRANVIAEILFDIFKADNQLVVRVGPLIREASRLGGNQAMQEAADATGIEKANLFTIADPVVQDKIRQHT